MKGRFLSLLLPPTAWLVVFLVLPTAVQARARVKFVGPSTFSMTYRYISVGGQSISEGRLAEASITDRRQ